MEYKEIKSRLADATLHVSEGRILESLTILFNLTSTLSLRNITSELNTLRETYSYLLHYMLEGMPDNSRDTMRGKIISRIYSIIDKIDRDAHPSSDNGYYYSQLRLNNLRKESIEALVEEYSKESAEISLAQASGIEFTELKRIQEDTLERLFSVVFTSLDNQKSIKKLTERVIERSLGDTFNIQMISAMTLSNFVYFDSTKFEALLEIYEHADSAQDEKLCAHSLLGIVMCLDLYGSRISKDKELINRLLMWNDSLLTYRRLRETVRVIVGSRDTDRVVKKMRTEVIPELMKLRPKFLKKIKEEGVDPEAIAENNPEWEEMLEKSGLSKKIEELGELQSEGADLMMVTFSNLKQFPFFDHAANWFLPFDPEHTALSIPEGMYPMINMMKESGGTVCDSDLYSLALASSKMPVAQQNMISGQFSEQMEAMRSEMKDAVVKSSTPEFDREILKSVRDIYRFFKLFRNKSNFSDPFAKPFSISKLPVAGELLLDVDIMRLLSEFYFKRGYYREALPMLNYLAENSEVDATLLEKIGYCHESLGDYNEARHKYEEAAMFRAPGEWRLKRLAVVCRKSDFVPDAIYYTERLLDLQPDNVSTLMNLGNLSILDKKYSEALNHFYHADYVNPGQPKILRALAWAELLNGNFKKSYEKYLGIITETPEASDYMNAGHASLLLGNFKEAANYYKLSREQNPGEFDMAFNGDIETLISLGLDKLTIQLILDASKI